MPLQFRLDGRKYKYQTEGLAGLLKVVPSPLIIASPFPPPPEKDFSGPTRVFVRDGTVSPLIALLQNVQRLALKAQTRPREIIREGDTSYVDPKLLGE